MAARRLWSRPCRGTVTVASDLLQYHLPTVHVGRKSGPHETRNAHWGPDAEGRDNRSYLGTKAPNTNGVFRLRAGFKSTTHEYLSGSCLL